MIVHRPDVIDASALDFASVGDVPIPPVRVQVDLSSIFSSLTLPFRKDYYSGFRKPEARESLLGLEDYLSSRDVGEGLMCPEWPLPRAVARAITLSSTVSWPQMPPKAVVQVHAGRAGCFSPVHFDWDQSLVLHVCLFGSRRLVFFPPSAGWLLSPVVNTSALCIPRYSCADLDLLLKSLNGSVVSLSAGQGVVFSANYWHGVVYDESSVAISVRLEIDRRMRAYAALPRNWLLQRLAWEMQSNPSAAGHEERLGRLVALFCGEATDWYERYRLLKDASRAELAELGMDCGVHAWIDDNFLPELALAYGELADLYDVTPWTECSGVDIDSAFNHLSEGCSLDLPESVLKTLALHMSVKRQGLPAKRGLVEIQQ